ncbi:MAG: glutamyl-tRNA reductase [Hydrogenibacillus sp.]|nr:glutamyl-tRNA reductase [Hydrogenibacillus sp.]
MHLLAIGLNYRSAPVELRERCTFLPERLPDAYRTLGEYNSIVEAVILATCNRTELYLVTDRGNVKAAEEQALRFMERWFGFGAAALRAHLYVHVDRQAVDHLLRVAVGLDSMVVGETQILGQVREAWERAEEAEATGKLLNTLFRRAVSFAKRMHTKWGLNDHPVSVGYAAVVLAKKLFGDFRSKRVVVIGAGELGELVLRHLADQGAQEIILANRTREKAEALAAAFGGRTIDFDRLPEAAARADIVVSSTSAPGYVLTREALAPHLTERRERPLILIDLAVPRDVDPALHGFKQVYVYDIDDLNGIVEANLNERRRIAARIETEVQAAVDDYDAWLRTLDVVPVIAALQAKGMSLQAKTMESLNRKLPDLDERSRRLLEKHTKNLVNQLLQDAVLYLKENAGTQEGRAVREALVKSFDLEPWMPAPASGFTSPSDAEREAERREAHALASRNDPLNGGLRLTRLAEQTMM